MGYHMAMMGRGTENHALREVKYEDVYSSEAHGVVFTCFCQAESDRE